LLQEKNKQSELGSCVHLICGLD